MELTTHTDIETVDPGGELRHRFAAFGVQAKKWEDDVLGLCLKDIEQRVRDGQESEHDGYVREQLVKHHLVRSAMSKA